MIVVLNFILSLIVLGVLGLAGLLFQIQSKGRMAPLAQWVFHSKIRAMVLYEISYLYTVISAGIWFGRMDPAVYGVLFLVGLGGAIAVPVDIHLSLKRRDMPSPATYRYIFQIVQDYETDELVEATAALEDLISRSHSDANAQDALDYLLHSKDRVGEFVRETVEHTQRASKS